MQGDDDEPIDTGEPRVRDLVKAGTLPSRGVVGEPLWDRLAQPRLAWRAVGCSKRLWMRVTGEDPFVGPERAQLARRTVYVDGRFVRLDRAAAEAGPRKPERGDGNKGEALIPEGFRSLPVAGPPPTAPPKAPPKRPAPPPTPPPPERTYSATGRMRGTVRRTPAGLGDAALPAAPPAAPDMAPTAAPPVPTPPVSRSAPPPAPDVAPPPAAPASASVSQPHASAPPAPPPETLDDVMRAAKEGRVRLKPRS